MICARCGHFLGRHSPHDPGFCLDPDCPCPDFERLQEDAMPTTDQTPLARTKRFLSAFKFAMGTVDQSVRTISTGNNETLKHLMLRDLEYLVQTAERTQHPVTDPQLAEARDAVRAYVDELLMDNMGPDVQIAAFTARPGSKAKAFRLKHLQALLHGASRPTPEPAPPQHVAEALTAVEGWLEAMFDAHDADHQVMLPNGFKFTLGQLAVVVTEANLAKARNASEAAAEGWDAGFEAGVTHVEHTSGIPHDPPLNPYSGISPEDPIDTPPPSKPSLRFDSQPSPRAGTRLMAKIVIELRETPEGGRATFSTGEDIHAQPLDPATAVLMVGGALQAMSEAMS